MSRRNRNRTDAPAETVTPAVEQTPETVVEPTTEPTETVTEPVADEPPAETVTTPPAETVKVGPAFWVNDNREFKPRRGFETVLYNALKDNIFTEAELVAHLLASGEYARVAPKAAELRPTKPTRFLLKVWTASKVLKTTAN